MLIQSPQKTQFTHLILQAVFTEYASMPNMNTNPCVKNIVGSEQSKLSCSCGSWLQHWRNYTGSKRKTCCVLKCQKDAKVGAHVISVDGRHSNHRYIAPMCYTHNHHSNTEHMFIDSRMELVWANKNGTCNYDYY